MIKLVSVLIVAVAILLLIVPGFFSSHAGSMVSEQTYVEVTVQPGDTVWDLARHYGPEGADLRQTAYRIAQANDLEGYVIRPGQTLRIPGGRPK